MPVSYVPLSGADGLLQLSSFNTRFQSIEDYFLALITGGAATQSTFVAEAGEGLGNRSPAYLNLSDNKIYQMDSDAAGPRAGTIRGFVDGVTTIGNDATLVISGLMDGFSALTAFGPVYAASIAGTITQTRPSASAGGAQVMVAEMGFAVASDTIIVRPRPIQYQKRDAMALDDTLTVTHHGDDVGYLRKVMAYLIEGEVGSSLTTYASSNQDSSVALRGPVLAGSTAATGSQTGSFGAIGDSGGTEYQHAQSFTLSAGGQLSQFKFTLIANTGTPAGTLDWAIRANNAGNPTGSILSSGSIANGSVTASAVNTVNISNGPILAASTTYWLVLSAAAQSSNNRWNWDLDTTGSYANGEGAYSTNGGSTWTKDGRDQTCEVTVSATVTSDKLSQGFQIGSSTTVATVSMWLKKTGSPTGNLTAKIYSDSAGDPNTLLGTSATVAASTLSTSYGAITFTFASPVSLSATTQYHLVLETADSQSDTNYVEWGADSSAPSYIDGEMKKNASSAWSALSMDAVFTVYGPSTYHPTNINVDWWGSSFADMVNRYGDGAGADLTTETTFKCAYATGFDDVTVVVELP